MSESLPLKLDFPKKSRSAKWVQATRRDDLRDKSADYLNRNCRICSEHFEKSQILCGRLVWNAIPTLFNIPNPPPSVSLKRKRPSRDTGTSSTEKRCKDSSMATHPDHTYAKIKPTASEVSEPQEPSSVYNDDNADPDSDVQTQPTQNEPESAQASAGTSKAATTSKDQVKSTERVKIHRLRNKVKHLKANLEKIPKQCGSVKNIIQDASKFLDETALHFFASQLRIGKRRMKGRRYTSNEKLMAFALHYQSPAAYRFCRKIKLFALPSERSLRRWLERVQVQPGFNDTSFEILKQKAETMSERERVCVLTLDEMSLKAGLYYDLHKDVIEGMEDFGSLGRTKNLATQALVFMVRGLSSKWKQPVGYFLSNGATPGNTQKVLLLECLQKVQDAGFIVKVVIGDQGSTNQKMFKELNICADKPYIELKSEDGRTNKVFFMFDPPHLLKNVRNNLKRHIFVVEGHEVKWNYIVEFYKHDSTLPLRMAPKLKSKHIELPPFANMRVNLAAQVMSHSVASGILTYASLGKLPSEAVYTAQFLERMDHLFDSFNARSLKCTKVYRRGVRVGSPHVQFWKDCIQWIKKWQIKDGSTERVACFSGWVLTISAVVQLFDELTTSGLFRFLFTNRLNQDCLENLFSIIRGRGGHRDNPSANEFRAALKQVMCSKMMVPLGRQNCEEDGSVFFNFTVSGASHSENRNVASLEQSDSVFQGLCDDLSESSDQLQMNAIVYVAGYLAKKTLAKHNCQTCKNALLNEINVMVDQSQLLTSFKAYSSHQSDFGGLTVPSENLVKFVEVCEKVFVKCFNNFFHIKHIGKRIVDRILAVTGKTVCLSLCQRDQEIKFVSFLVRFRLHAAVKFYNKDLTKRKTDQKGKRKNRKLIKISHVSA